MNNDQEIILAKISAVYDKPPFVKKVVQDLTSGGEDCFPKYTKQFLIHYYDTNEIF